MSRIKELIDELCPDGVPYRPLGEIATLVRGNGMPKTDLTEEGVGAIHYGQIYTHYGVWTDSTISFVSPSTAARLARVDPGDVIITNTSENLEDVGKAVAWVGDKQIVTGGHATVIKHHMNPKFLAYWFQTPDFFRQKKTLATGTKVIDVSAKSLMRVRVPVPSFGIQQEIVRILDAFTSLEAELEAELEARRVQYVFHASALFGAVPPRLDQSLSELAEFRYGYTATAEDDGDYRFIRITDIDSFGKLRKSGAKYVSRSDDADRFLTKRGDVLVARTGATFGKTLLVSDEEDSVFASFMIRLRFDCSQVAPNYYWHFAQSSLYWRQANLLVSHGGQQQFNANALRNVIVPVPSLVEQQRIAEILDEFDSLLSSFSSGLPAEIAARRQQYEYYRDQLLTFKELSA